MEGRGSAYRLDPAPLGRIPAEWGWVSTRDLREGGVEPISAASAAVGDSRTLESLRRLTDSPASQRRARADTLLSLVEALRVKDAYTARHSARVATVSHHLAVRLNCSDPEIERIRIAAVLHDVGKIGIPDAILTKPGRLTKEEFDHMKRHPVMGVDILEPIGFLRPVLALVRHHHEWVDGTGYPDGLRGEAIPFGASVIQAADSIDAMMSPRSYKRGYDIAEVIAELEQGAGTQFHPCVAEAAVDWLEQNPSMIQS